MAQSVKVVRNTLPASAGSSDFTFSGFGTVAAAIIIVSNANTTNNPQEDSQLSIGFWDGTNQRAMSYAADDNLTTTDTFRASSNSLGVFANTNHGTSYSVSAITDGIRLTMVADNTAGERYCTVILLGGVSAKVFTFTPGTTNGSTAASASLGFAPTAALFMTVGLGAENTNLGTALLSFGVALADGTHRMICQHMQDGATTSASGLNYSETRCCGQTSTAINWAIEITTWGADTFTATTREGSTASDICFVLALGGDVSCELGSLVTGTSSLGVSGITPEALLLGQSTAIDTNYASSNGAEGVSYGLADADGEYSHGVASEDAAGTSNEMSFASATSVIDLYDSDGGAHALVANATIDSLAAGTLTWNTAPGTARKGFWLAFGPVASGGGNRRRRLICGAAA